MDRLRIETSADPLSDAPDGLPADETDLAAQEPLPSEEELAAEGGYVVPEKHADQQPPRGGAPASQNLPDEPA